ncbi:MAG: hypothetical protein MI743_03465 [Sneathiellales bacterium]|nr:hypothetical protein [Sneathiellales bacterium]
MTEKTETMLNHLERLLDQYGADESRWPAEERIKLGPFLASSREAQLRLEREREFETMLGSHAEDNAPAGLLGRVLEDAHQVTTQSKASQSWFLPYLKPISSLAFAASLGFIIGVVNPELLETEDDLYFTENALTETITEWGLENDNG